MENKINVEEYFEANKPWKFSGNWEDEKNKLAIYQAVFENKEIKWDDLPGYIKYDRNFLIDLIKLDYRFFEGIPADIAIEDCIIKGITEFAKSWDDMLKDEYENSFESKDSISLEKYIEARKIQMTTCFRSKISQSKKECGLIDVRNKK